MNDGIRTHKVSNVYAPKAYVFHQFHYTPNFSGMPGFEPELPPPPDGALPIYYIPKLLFNQR